MNPFFSPKAVEHEVNGQLYKFYPNRVYVLGKLRDFLKPLFKALSTLTSDHSTDIGRESVETKDNEGGIQLRTTLQPIDTKLAAQRAAEKERLLDKVIEDLTAPPAMRAIGLLIMDSLRDDFDKRPDDAKIQGFLDEVPLDVLVQMLKGVAKANKEVFGPLGKQVEAAMGRLKTRLDASSPEESESEAPPSEQPEPQLSESQTTPSGAS